MSCIPQGMSLNEQDHLLQKGKKKMVNYLN